MNNTIKLLLFFSLLVSGCTTPTANDTTPLQNTPPPANNPVTESEILSTATAMILPTQIPSPFPTPTLTPTVTPPGISGNNFSEFAVTTQYRESLTKAVPDITDQYVINGLLISPDGRYVAIGGCTAGYRFRCPSDVYGYHAFLVILDADTAEVVSILPEKETTITGMQFSPDGRQLVYATFPQRVVIWDISSQMIERTLFNNDQSDTKIRMKVNPVGSSIAVSSLTGLMILDYASGDLLMELPAKGYTPHYSADGARLVMNSSEDGREITVYDTATWAEISRIQIPDESDFGYSLDISPDGNWIVTNPEFAESFVRLWDANTGEQVDLLEAPPGEVLSIEFSPDNRLLLISIISDLEMIGKITIWDVATWRQLGILNNYSENGNMVFNSTGETMLGSNGSDIWRWSRMDEQVVKSREVVLEFFDDLSRKDFTAAAAIYQLDVYAIENFNSLGFNTTDTVSLLEQVCASNTRICLPVLNVLPGGGLSPFGEYEVHVQFQSPDGSPFVDSYGMTDSYVMVYVDAEQQMKVSFIPYNE